MQHGSKDNSGRIEAAVAANLKRYFAAAAFFINTFQIAKKPMAKTAMTKRQTRTGKVNVPCAGKTDTLWVKASDVLDSVIGQKI